jgi:hypothetical protein
VLVSILPACSSTQSFAQPSVDPEVNPLPMPLSVIQMPIRLHKEALQTDINVQLGDTLYVDDDADGEGMYIRAEKAEPISIDFDGEDILYRVPVDLFIKKEYMIANLGATGAIAMSFRTSFDILPDWTLETKTVVEDYEWLTRPKLQVGVINIPIKLIANLVLNRTGDLIGEAVDEQVRANLDLRKEMENAWAMMHSPIELSSEYRTYMIMKPRNIFMTPMTADGITLESVVVLESEPQVFLGELPQADPAGPIPDFMWKNHQDRGFELLVQTDILFSEAERLAKENMVGQEFSSGKKSVTVEDLDLFGLDDKIVVKTTLSGAYNGAINLIGKPTFNPEKGEIELQDLDVEVKTKNVLHKSLGWLFKSTFKKEIQKNLNYYLDYYMTYTRETVEKDFKDYPVYPGILMNGNLDDLTIDKLFVTPEAIRVWIDLKGGLEIDIRGLMEME